MNITYNIRPSTDEEGQPIYEACCYTEGYGVKGTGYTEGKALRDLVGKLKAMNRFSRIARSILETKIGYHKYNINFKLEHRKE